MHLLFSFPPSPSFFSPFLLSSPFLPSFLYISSSSFLLFCIFAFDVGKRKRKRERQRSVWGFEVWISGEKFILLLLTLEVSRLSIKRGCVVFLAVGTKVFWIIVPVPCLLKILFHHSSDLFFSQHKRTLSNRWGIFKFDFLKLVWNNFILMYVHSIKLVVDALKSARKW